MKSISLGLLLVAVAAISIGAIANNANAKESSCDVSAGGKCLIIAKRGDIEIDKLTIIVGSGGGSPTNLTAINNAITALQGQMLVQTGINTGVNSTLNALAAQVANFSDTGITSIEITPVNETSGGNTTEPIPEPIPPVENTTDTGNVTDTNSTG